jgi:3-deoxy-D-manno-octulosonic-acid transferase
MGVRLAALWNPKAKLWVDGRKDIFDQIRSELHTAVDPAPSQEGQPSAQDVSTPLIWMHCASLGEFEQGRPLLEAFRAGYPQARRVLSFFSPSGVEAVKGQEGADHVFYLPVDTAENAVKFIDALQPSLVLWVKYEFWFHYLDALRNRNIPVILVSGIFRPDQPFFKWYGAIWRQMLQCFTHLFVQNDESAKLLEGLGIQQRVSVTGDTRFDRVISIAENAVPLPHIAGFCGSNKILVAGSTWEEDEVELLHYTRVHPEMKFIIAPHEVDAENIADVKKMFPGSVAYSQWVATYGTGQTSTSDPGPSPNILIMDNIGMLSRLYRYATIAYIGGGFGDEGVHNVLEAAVYGKPVVFGPVYEKYDEAVGLLEAGGAVSYSSPLGLEAILEKFTGDEAAAAKAGTAAKEFVYANAGATRRIIRFIQENRLFTS